MDLKITEEMFDATADAIDIVILKHKDMGDSERLRGAVTGLL